MIILTSEQKVNLVVEPKTAAGNVAQVQNPLWTVSDENVASIQQSADGLSATVFAVGVGNCQINLVVDTDLTDGVRELQAVLDISVVGAEAATLSIAAGVPELK